MRAADDFATIRSRMEQLQRERGSTAERREPVVRGEELDRLDLRAVQRMKDEMKTRIITRNRIG
jgi:hypothetical protein